MFVGTSLQTLITHTCLCLLLLLVCGIIDHAYTCLSMGLTFSSTGLVVQDIFVDGPYHLLYAVCYDNWSS